MTPLRISSPYLHVATNYQAPLSRLLKLANAFTARLDARLHRFVRNVENS